MKNYKDFIKQQTNLLEKLGKGNLSQNQLINIAKKLGNIQNKISIFESKINERKKIISKFYYQKRKARMYSGIIDEFANSQNLRNDFYEYTLIKTKNLSNDVIKKITNNIKNTEKYFGLSPSLSSGKIKFQVKSKLYINKFKDRENEYESGDNSVNFSTSEKSEFMKSGWEAIRYDGIRDVKYFESQIENMSITNYEKSQMINQLMEWMEKI